MPYCDACARHWTPTSMRPDGSCPTCGQVLELRASRHPSSPPAAAATEATVEVEAPEEDDAADLRPKAPWHFKVMLAALVLYLGWRGVQGVDWIAHHL